MKQTAVDWLKDMLEWNYGDPKMLEISWVNLDDLFERAKQMEKEQIEQAYGDGINHDYSDLDIEFGIGSSDREYHAEKYYNQTYLYK